MIAHSCAKQLQLEAHDFNEVIQVEETGAFTAPCSGYIEVNLWISQFPQYEEMILMLVIPDSQNTNRDRYSGDPEGDANGEWAKF